MEAFKEAFTLFPWYIYIGLMIVSLLIGVGLRKHFEKKDILKAKQAKMELKEMKKEAKRQARLRKKKLNQQKK